ERDRWEWVTPSRSKENQEDAAETRAPLQGTVYEGGPHNGYRGWPLHRRLAAMAKHRELKRKDLAALFGVSPAIITYWLHGTEPGPDGKVTGKPIPDSLAPLMIRWLETGQEPTPEELASRRGRRTAGGRPCRKATS